VLVPYEETLNCMSGSCIGVSTTAQFDDGNLQELWSYSQQLQSENRSYQLANLDIWAEDQDFWICMSYTDIGVASFTSDFTGSYYGFWNNQWNIITGNGDDFFYDGGGLECFAIAQTADFDSFASIYSAVPGNPNGSTYINLYVSLNATAPDDGILNVNDHAYIDNLTLTILNTSSADVSGFTEKYGNAMLWIGGTFLVFAFFLSVFRLWRRLRASLSGL